jgi:hypothetical protein
MFDKIKEDLEWEEALSHFIEIGLIPESQAQEWRIMHYNILPADEDFQKALRRVS